MVARHALIGRCPSLLSWLRMNRRTALTPLGTETKGTRIIGFAVKKGAQQKTGGM